MKNMIFIFFFSIITFAIFLSCNNDDFSPLGDPPDRYSIFCILDNRSPVQFASIQKLFNENKPSSVPENAKLVISENFSKSYYFKDTIFPNLPNNRIFYLNNYKFKRNILYRIGLIVDSVSVISAETFIAGNPWYQSYTRLDTNKQKEINNINYITYLYVLSTSSDVQLIRIFIEYEINESGNILKDKVEVPVSMEIDGITENERIEHFYEYPPEKIKITYPELMGSKTASYYIVFPDKSFFIRIMDEYEMYAMKQIPYTGDPKNVTIKRAYAEYISIDKYLYENYFKKSGNQYSVRLDEPPHISNSIMFDGKGYGLVGAITSDTLIFKIPKVIATHFGFKDGQ